MVASRRSNYTASLELQINELHPESKNFQNRLKDLEVENEKLRET